MSIPSLNTSQTNAPSEVAVAHAKTLMSLDDALALILAAAPTPGVIEQVDTFDALGRVLAQDLASAIDVPPLDNSAMDGYALRCTDVPAAGATLPVSQRIVAGTVGTELQPGTAARIFTGAPVPTGADAVVMQEHCTAVAADDAGTASVCVNTLPRLGDAIRRRGEDIRAGSVVLVRGTRLSPQAMGLAASVGAASLPVWRRARVALLSTGDELAMPGQPLKPGCIYNSNRFTLRGLIEALGAECRDLGIVADSLDATRAALREAALDSDLIISSGGVSVGEEDHLKPAVQAEGELSLWKLAIKPGKPLAFGRVFRPSAVQGSEQEGAALFVGLPGNPVASFVTFLIAVRPLLARLSGREDAPAVVQALRADFEWPKADRQRREFLRARRNAEGGVELYPHQGSGVLTSALWADGLVDLAPGQTVQRGDRVRFVAFADLGV